MHLEWLKAFSNDEHNMAQTKRTWCRLRLACLLFCCNLNSPFYFLSLFLSLSLFLPLPDVASLIFWRQRIYLMAQWPCECLWLPGSFFRQRMNFRGITLFYFFFSFRERPDGSLNMGCWCYRLSLWATGDCQLLWYNLGTLQLIQHDV